MIIGGMDSAAIAGGIKDIASTIVIVIMNFRDVEKKLCIIVDEQTAKLLSPDVEANALLCMGYVDHMAGLTYEALALANYCDGDYSVVWEAKEICLKIRAGSVANKIIMPIENKVLLNKFQSRIEILENYYTDADVLECRAIEELDKFRHPEFPDDLAMFLAKKGNKMETIWVRALSFIGTNEHMIAIKVQLLNEPYSDFGVHIHNEIDAFSFIDDNGERVFAHVVRE